MNCYSTPTSDYGYFTDTNHSVDSAPLSETHSSLINGNKLISIWEFRSKSSLLSLKKDHSNEGEDKTLIESDIVIVLAEGLINLIAYNPILSNSLSDPFITAESENEICMEWWNKDRKLTIFIEEDSLSYLKSWGPDINTEMQDDLLTSNSLFDCAIWLGNA